MFDSAVRPRTTIACLWQLLGGDWRDNAQSASATKDDVSLIRSGPCERLIQYRLVVGCACGKKRALARREICPRGQSAAQKLAASNERPSQSMVIYVKLLSETLSLTNPRRVSASGGDTRSEFRSNCSRVHFLFIFESARRRRRQSLANNALDLEFARPN